MYIFTKGDSNLMSLHGHVQVVDTVEEAVDYILSKETEQSWN